MPILHKDSSYCLYVGLVAEAVVLSVCLDGQCNAKMLSQSKTWSHGSGTGISYNGPNPYSI